MEISISQIIWRIMIIFLLAFFGVVAQRFKLITEEARSSFADVMINLTLPSLIFVTLTTEVKWERLVEGVFAPLIAIILILMILLIAYFSRRFIPMSTDRFRTFLVLCAMPNTGFIGFPVVFSVLGNEGLVYAVLFDLGVNVAFFSIIIAILKDWELNYPLK
jgi:predicted permease